jgi:hypothetical protein
VRHPVDGDDQSRAIRPPVTVDEDGPVTVLTPSCASFRNPPGPGCPPR